MECLGKGKSFPQMVLGTRIPNRNLMKLYLTPHAKVNSRWLVIQHVKYKAVKLLEDNIGKYFHDLAIEKDFFNRAQKILP